MQKNTTDKTLIVPLNSEYGNTGFKVVPNPDYRKTITVEFRQWRYKPTDTIISRPNVMGHPGNDWEEVITGHSYTLTQLEQLAREYCDKWEGETESIQTEFRLALSLLFQWAKQREKEGGDGT